MPTLGVSAALIPVNHRGLSATSGLRSEALDRTRLILQFLAIVEVGRLTNAAIGILSSAQGSPGVRPVPLVLRQTGPITQLGKKKYRERFFQT